MADESTQDYFPRQQVYNYLKDIELRERLIEEHLKLITISRHHIELLVKCSEKQEEET